MTTTRRITVSLVLAASIAGCGGQTATPRTTTSAPPTGGAPSTTASGTPDVGAEADDPAFGAWRRSPIRPAGDFTGRVEDACRAEAVVGDLPLAVLDARGEGLATLVFADGASAAVCRAAVDRGGGVAAEAREVKDAAGATPPGAGRLGIHDLEVLAAGANPRSVLVGQVGAQVHSVGVNFDADAAWSTAAMANGWYAIWWPGLEMPLGVASSDARSVVIDSYAP